jgi:hypothetical protein
MRETLMESSSSCSCRLGGIVRALGLGSRLFPKKRQWQFVCSIILFLFAFFFYMAITKNPNHHGVLSLGIFSFFGIATFLAASLGAVVSIVGCDECVSRM